MKFTGTIKFIILSLFCALVFSCKDSYEPNYESRDNEPILVVEGYINALGASSRYKLSQTVPISAKTEDGIPISIVPVTGAILIIESESGEIYQHQQSDADGNYTFYHPILDTETRYRLRIRVNNEEYLSSYVDVRISPEIERVDWEETADGVQLYVSTQDPNNDSHYYRWEYEETWRFFSRFNSELIYTNGAVRDRTREEQVSICFFSENSSDIQIATSDGLSGDIIYNYPIRDIPRLSEKLEIRYSILVKQYVLSKEGYTYWDELRKNSENLGDIFGTMPTELRGNISNANDPQEAVIGMIEAVGVREKRIFIDNRELSEQWLVESEYYSGCALSDTTINAAIQVFRDFPGLMPVYGFSVNPASLGYTHYAYSSRRCADCTVRGTLTAPDFWQD
ncbi:DUF4249 domain-containing protein [Olivibacter sitiensis]|uniref:DUF4249 domain-containing protein n=1 Tax=Olivibacter sitiensis TaxID=376470 RepID=UPI00040FA4D1|nr:DUF4249 domain-containing protein [Olivibacter sitiensis]